MICFTYWGAVLHCDVYGALRRVFLEDVSLTPHALFSPLYSLHSSLLVSDQSLNARGSPSDNISQRPLSIGMSIGGYYHELGSLMTSPLHTIIPRDASGRPGPPLTAADPVAMNIIRSISTCKNLMMHPTARDAFEKIAQDYAAARPNNWFRVHQPPMTTNEVTNTFLTKVLNTFPTVFIDYSLRNPDYGAYHSRRQWEENFEPKHQAISINGMVIETLDGYHHLGL